MSLWNITCSFTAFFFSFPVGTVFTTWPINWSRSYCRSRSSCFPTNGKTSCSPCCTQTWVVHCRCKQNLQNRGSVLVHVWTFSRFSGQTSDQLLFLTSDLESCSHLAGDVSEGLIHPLGESLVHSLCCDIIAREPQEELDSFPVLLRIIQNKYCIYESAVCVCVTHFHTPVVLFACEEENFARAFIIKSCINFLDFLWQTKSGNWFRIIRNKIIATESPHFIICREMRRHRWVFYKTLSWKVSDFEFRPKERANTFKEKDSVWVSVLKSSVNVGGSLRPEVRDETLFWGVALGIATPKESENTHNK